MKKNFKWSLVPLILIIAFLFVINPKVDDDVVDGRKLSKWNKEVEQIEGGKSPSRAIASIVNKNIHRKNTKVIPYKKFKKDTKYKMKNAKQKSFKYRSISPDQGPDFQNGVGNYKFLDFFYAIANTEENRKIYPEAQIKLGYIIVESETPITDALAVVENADTGHLGIFTGILKVKLKDMQDVDQVIEHNQYEIEITHDHISLVQYRIDDIALALKTHEELTSNPKVKRVSLEILEYQRTQL